jgi:low temperature requirement protein LtrA
MLGILALAVGVSGAAEGDGFVFALAAAGLRIPLLLLWLRARHGAPPGVRGFSSRYAAGTAWAIAFWGASAFVESPAQEVLWAVALAGEMAAPYAAVRRADRPVYDPGHIVERYGLFTIIVLGESILAVVIGTGQVDLDPAAGLTAAFGFAASAAFWWLYFDRVGPGGLGRSRRAGFLWGYGHLVVWSGVAVIGVGTHLAVEASAGGVATAEAAAAGPGGYAGDTPLAFLPAGAALALTALAMIALTSGGLRQAVAVRLAGATLLTVSAFLADGLGPMPTAAITAAVLVIVTCVESRQAATGRSPGGGPATPS